MLILDTIMNGAAANRLRRRISGGMSFVVFQPALENIYALLLME